VITETNPQTSPSAPCAGADRVARPLAVGQRVQYVGFTGRADGQTGRVSRVLKSGAVRVRWDNGDTYDVHPQDVRPAAAVTR